MPRWIAHTVPDMPFKTTVDVRATMYLADGTTKIEDQLDTIGWIQAHCATVPPVIWGIGRQDGFATWQEQLDVIAVRYEPLATGGEPHCAVDG